ncbi:MAG: hypothetical protein LJE83_04255 [Gammaproteobacteria bacterium]|nr:hypothetical protein [Gammaproteobacteria bacterium]
MTQRKSDLDELLEKLKQGRDELNVKMHLGKAEAKDLWQETEDKWRHLRSQLDEINDDTGDVAKDVGATAILLAEEIKEGYERLKKML